MLNFFRKKTQPAYPAKGYEWLAQDIHSHLLPGLDDGSPDIETSLYLIRSLQDIGINKFICTPHILSDMYRNTPEKINAALTKLKSACEENNLNVNIRAAAEYMLDDGFSEKLKQGEPLLTLEKNYILTEFPYLTKPVRLNEVIFDILSNNYQPLLAHPERYHYYHKDYDAFFKLKEAGFHLQVNLLSLTGYYGKSVTKAAKFILQNNLASFVGTDLHHEKHLEALSNPEFIALFDKYLGDRKWNEFG